MAFALAIGRRLIYPDRLGLLLASPIPSVLAPANTRRSASRSRILIKAIRGKTYLARALGVVDIFIASKPSENPHHPCVQ